MNQMDELIQICDKLCSNIDRYIDEEKKLSIDLQMVLERYSCEIFKTRNGLKEIKFEIGV